MSLISSSPDRFLSLLGSAGLQNPGVGFLQQEALRRGEVVQTAAGVIAADTGDHTGRSPGDKFFVRDPEVVHHIDWKRNQGMEPAQFLRLREDMLAHLQKSNFITQDLYVGAAAEHRMQIRTVTEYAWHALFIHHLLCKPEPGVGPGEVADFTVVDVPTFRANPEIYGCKSETVIAVSFAERLVLIGGTAYAGEMKKSIFTVLNYLLPAQGVMPMHCSANHEPGKPDNAAVFFGLSGTGKTTLSATAARTLVGDDEHGWGDGVLYNFEGGCYAKVVELSEKSEPDIYRAAGMAGTVLENVYIDPATNMPDFMNNSKTENSRAAYPIEAIQHASPNGLAGEPNVVIMLACDAFGVLPPVARLDPDQAEYHFLSGFTSKVAGTERGLSGPTPTFSACFGAPFMPRSPIVYGNLLRERIRRRKPSCWLVNTGWSGGGVGVGQRMPIATTRRLLELILSGGLAEAPGKRDLRFGFEVPITAEGVDDGMLDPRHQWSDGAAYDAMADRLSGMFKENFKVFASEVDQAVHAAGPA